jgi:hypothetical protein
VPRDITRFTQVLTPPSQWLESVDPRLGAIGDLVGANKFDAAADTAEEVLAEGYLDIRPISVLLYASFVERGVDGIPAIVEAADLAVRDNFDAIGPNDKKKKALFDKRLGWLFERIVDQLEYGDKTKSEQFTAWTSKVAEERVELAAAATGTLTAMLASATYDVAPRAAGRLASWLRARAEMTVIVPMPAPVAAAPEPAPRTPVIAEEDPSRVSLRASHKFHELMQKLRAFETLVAKGRHEKAAVVAADVQQLIEHFDPRAYFPELFSEFAALMSENVATIAAHMDLRETPAWSAMDQFYRVDLKAFVER